VTGKLNKKLVKKQQVHILLNWYELTGWNCIETSVSNQNYIRLSYISITVFLRPSFFVV